METQQKLNDETGKISGVPFIESFVGQWYKLSSKVTIVEAWSDYDSILPLSLLHSRSRSLSLGLGIEQSSTKLLQSHREADREQRSSIVVHNCETLTARGLTFCVDSFRKRFSVYASFAKNVPLINCEIVFLSNFTNQIVRK